ncbi:PHAGE CAPSID SCAFFOLDING PROTEIN (GPO) SERINE PEPTIDASE [Salix koriyanagi]|uniref:PHAGE CAPSID SCAFFOLDING PROTEIN (GPO) SERINE PEPTIDASE n=1 Tax=Salix koriyanagi TaxID=2511006 RepID=A0A9Q0TDC0_9ROSI|nr:PHAGE CAPSID SCAFFOLDING PROTEIN (GPO) SERINE PEPTIDASE [Salix koriyanagi]
MVSATRSMVPCSSVSHTFLVPGPVSVSTSEISKFKHKSQSLGNQRLEIFSTSLKLLYAKNTKMQMAVYSSVGTGSAHPSAPSPCRKGWILGVLLSVILPFCRNKWGGLLLMKDKIEAVVELADQVADIVEEVAEGVEKVADEVADHLPEGGRLKQVATFVENVARETAKDADLIDDVIEKVQPNTWFSILAFNYLIPYKTIIDWVSLNRFLITRLMYFSERCINA